MNQTTRRIERTENHKTSAASLSWSLSDLMGGKKKAGVWRARIFSDRFDVAEQYTFCTIMLEKAREGIYLLIFVVVS